MLEIEILIRKCLGTINRSTTSAIAVEEVSPLDHEIFDLRSQSVNLYPCLLLALRSLLTTRWNLLPL